MKICAMDKLKESIRLLQLEVLNNWEKFIIVASRWKTVQGANVGVLSPREVSVNDYATPTLDPTEE